MSKSRVVKKKSLYIVENNTDSSGLLHSRKKAIPDSADVLFDIGLTAE
jgi:hypothetical protein